MTAISDSFTGTAGADISAHTPDTGPAPIAHPSAAGGDAISSAGRFYQNGATGAYYYPVTTQITESDTTLTVRLITALNVNLGVAARIQLADDTMYIVRYNKLTGKWDLVRTNAGVFTVIASVVQALTLNQDYALVFQCHNDAKTVLVDTVSIISNADNNISQAGYPGVRTAQASADATGLHGDNLTVTSLDAAVATTGSGWKAVERRRRRELLKRLIYHRIHRGS